MICGFDFFSRDFCVVGCGIMMRLGCDDDGGLRGGRCGGLLR